MRGFASFHPSVLFFYYLLVIGMTVFMMHPIILLCSLIGSMTFFLMLTKRKQFIKDLGFYLLVYLLIVITYPLFFHKGETILFFYNDYPMTLEAILYGGNIGMMIIAICFWSKAYSALMTSDKVVYLFGKTIPKLSLFLSVTLKFIPVFKQQIKKVNATQRTLGLYTSDSITDRLLNTIRTFNGIFTWSLENSIHQTDAMKARGYGLKGRTNFSVFYYKRRDFIVFIFILMLFILIMVNHLNGNYQFTFFPVIDSIVITKISFIQYIIVGIFLIFPFIYEVKEHIQWKLLQSKMSTSPIQIQLRE